MPSLESTINAQKAIDQTLHEFKQLFSAVFFKNIARELKPLPPEDAEKLFNSLWEQMEAAGSSDAKEVLDRYFTTIKADTLALKDKRSAPATSSSPIAKSCDAMAIRLSWLHRTEMTTLFTHIISVYHWLANQQLFFRQLHDYQVLHIELMNANTLLQKKYNAIDLVCQRFLSVIQKRGHLQSQSPWIMFEKHPLAAIDKKSQQLVEEIDNKLATMPNSKKLNKLFTSVQQQGQMSADGKLRAAAQANFLARTVEDIKALAEHCLSVYKEVPCHVPTNASDLPTHKLERMTGDMGAAIFEITNIDQEFQALADACYEKGDKNTAEKIAAWSKVSACIKTFKEEYARDFTDEQAAGVKTFTFLTDKIKQEKICHNCLQQKINQAEVLFSNSTSCFKTLSEQCDFISNIKSEATVGSFFQNNWKKILLGVGIGLLFAGGAAVIGTLLVTLNVFALAAVIVGGFVLGASIGLIVGVKTEKPPKPTRLTDKDVESLLGYDTIAKRKKQSVEISVPVSEPVEQTPIEQVTQEQAAAESVFAFFPSAERVTQAAAMIVSPDSAIPDRQASSKSL